MNRNRELSLVAAAHRRRPGKRGRDVFMCAARGFPVTVVSPKETRDEVETRSLG